MVSNDYMEPFPDVYYVKNPTSAKRVLHLLPKIGMFCALSQNFQRFLEN